MPSAQIVLHVDIISELFLLEIDTFCTPCRLTMWFWNTTRSVHAIWGSHTYSCGPFCQACPAAQSADDHRRVTAATPPQCHAYHWIAHNKCQCALEGWQQLRMHKYARWWYIITVSVIIVRAMQELPMGIANAGNTCFAGALLQCLRTVKVSASAIASSVDPLD